MCVLRDSRLSTEVKMLKFSLYRGCLSSVGVIFGSSTGENHAASARRRQRRRVSTASQQSVVAPCGICAAAAAAARIVTGISSAGIVPPETNVASRLGEASHTQATCRSDAELT